MVSFKIVSVCSFHGFCDSLMSVVYQFVINMRRFMLKKLSPSVINQREMNLSTILKLVLAIVLAIVFLD